LLFCRNLSLRQTRLIKRILPGSFNKTISRPFTGTGLHLLHVNYQCYGGSKKKNPRLADIIASMAAQIFVTLALERKTERETERKRERQVREKRLFRRRGLVAGQTFPADCTGVSLPLRLLLFVYYNLDTIISLSSSRPSFSLSLSLSLHLSVALSITVYLAFPLALPRARHRHRNAGASEGASENAHREDERELPRARRKTGQR